MADRFIPKSESERFKGFKPVYDENGNVNWVNVDNPKYLKGQILEGWAGSRPDPGWGRMHPQLGQIAQQMHTVGQPTGPIFPASAFGETKHLFKEQINGKWYHVNRQTGQKWPLEEYKPVKDKEGFVTGYMKLEKPRDWWNDPEPSPSASTPPSVADGRVSPVTFGKPQSSGQPYPSGDYEPIVANGKVVGYKDLQTGRVLSTRDIAPVTWGQPSMPQETPAMPAAAPTPATAPAKGKPAAKGAGKAKAAAAELAALKAMSEGTSGAAGAPPSPTTQQSVPMTPSGRPDYNYYADMMNAVDSNDAYYRDFVRLRNDARMAARQAQIRGERFQFVPLRDYKSNRVYLVNADGTDVVLNMDDPQDQKQYQRMVSDLGIDSNRLSDWTDRSSRPLARYFMPQGMQNTTPDFGFLPRRPMVDESKAAPAAQPKEPGMPMPETQSEPSPMGLSLARGPMLPKGQQLRMPGAGPAFTELELAAMGYRQPSAAPPATPSASRPADVMPKSPMMVAPVQSSRSQAFYDRKRQYPEEQAPVVSMPEEGIDKSFAPVVLPAGRQYPLNETVETPAPQGIDPQFTPVVLQPRVPDEEEKMLRAYLTPPRGY